MPTEAVHFTVGENTGWLVTSIAREKLMYDYDPIKAIKTLTESFSGLPDDLALKVIKGDIILTVDVENQEIIPIEYIDELKELYPKADLNEWYQCKRKELINTGNGLKDALDGVLFTTLKSSRYGKFHATLDFQQVMDFINGDVKGVLDEIRDINEVQRLTDIIVVCKRYIEESLKLSKALDYVTRSKILREGVDRVSDTEHYEIVTQVSDKLSTLMRADMLKEERINDSVYNYIESQQNIDQVISKGIEPVNIMDNYSAGWLSPSGDYYALNGEIGNMLHNQIADALKEKGYLSMDENDISPESYLERAGWVKIQGDNVQFAGNLNNKIGRVDKYLTKKQVQKIKDYINLCHNGKMRLGWKLSVVSAAMFEMMGTNNSKKLCEYFEF